MELENTPELEMNEVNDVEWLAYFDREAENDALARGMDLDFKSYEG